MRTIIAGSRNITDINVVRNAIKSSNFKVTTVISGGARGVDKLGEELANKFNIPLEIYPADWDKYGKSAGYVRNELMASKADALIAIWDGQSRGTKHMIDLAEKYKLKIFIYKYE